MRLLFVCTGNLCRSPIAERFALALAERALGPSAAGVQIHSAGVSTNDGRPMDPHSAQALEELGGDPSGFASRQLLADHADAADLTFTMTGHQRHQLLKQAPRGLRRTFTLIEAHELLRLIDPRDLRDVTTFPVERRASELAAHLNEARSQRRTSPDDDVEDPIGQPKRVHREVAATIADHFEPLAAVLFAAPPPVTVIMPSPLATSRRSQLLR
jgi:protein-tyrosine phosphatase